MALKKRELGETIEAVFAENGLKTQEEIAIYLGLAGIPISQPTVSRMLKGTYQRQPDCLEDVCKHAGISLNAFRIEPDPTSSRDLMNALKSAWDGSTPREQFLVRVIKAAGRLGHTVDQRSN